MKKLTLFAWCIWLLACTAPPVEAQTVYVTKTGKKYHDEYCQYLSHSKVELELSKALELGYDACSICKPVTEVEGSQETEEATPASERPDDNNTPAPSSKPAPPTPTKKATASSQCSALTKAGARCKRTASANGRCWQHQ
jgi:hypothetical protein